MKIKILFFGILTDISKQNEIEINNVDNVADLKSYLFKTYPNMKDMDFTIALNKEIISNNEDKFKNNDELALLPPFAGG